MLDLETKSLWSHLLGRGMQGQHKGTLLKVLPSDITTWSAWKNEHPETTVLNLRRSSRQFVKDFYKEPKRFVAGFVGNFAIYHVSMDQLLKQSIANIDAKGLPLLIVFDPEGTATRIFRRKLGDQVLTFTASSKDKLKDDESGSAWNRSGVAIEGPLKGKSLEQQVSIPSFRRAWQNFHPDSRLVDLTSLPSGNN